MAPSLLLFLHLLSALSAAVTSQQLQSNITLGSSLSPTGRAWLSPSGRFAFGFYSKGNGFGIGVSFARTTPERRLVLVWEFNRDGPPVSADSTVLLNADGNLVLQTGQGQESLISNGAGAASSASMLDSGNFLLYDSNSRSIWETFDYPTDTILSGQRLRSGSRLVSSISESNYSTGRFYLGMQADGNLVAYPIDRINSAIDSYWSTGTFDQGNNVTLNLSEDGALYLLNNTGYYIRNLSNQIFSTDTTSVYRAKMEPDGIFRVYSHGFAENGSQTIEIVHEIFEDRCRVRGICGLNGICIYRDTVQDCICPPGFDYVDLEHRFLGCEKNFTDESCRIRRENMSYSISALENTLWMESNPYSTLSQISREDCSNSCLHDCNCEVALFREGTCIKQKLPLRFGRRDMGDSTTAFVKYGIGSATTNPVPEAEETENRRTEEVPILLLVTSITLIALSFIFLAFSGFLIYKHRLGRYKKISSDQNSIDLTEDIALKSFTYQELEKATDGFKEELGRGAFGTVFKGTLLNSKRVVAIKRLEKVAEEGEKEFRTEMRAIGRTHHKNLVRLLGFCDDRTHKLLVYEFMSNGSLADLLFKPERRPNWNERVGIALDVARGILYLHEECETHIIHCDIKPQNILMGEFHVAKIADFGLAKLMKSDQTRTFTGIRGTRGYVAPEWHKNMPITVKADVYSFGIVLLEIICCRRSVDVEVAEDEVILSDWVYDCFEAGEVGKLTIGEEVDKRRLERMVRVGLWCIQDEPSLRPSMKKVVLMLEGTVEIPIPPAPTSFLSAL